MGTAEILIVFSALMALIALVTIGIDWISKPLKNRRFIPRIYRFDDEKLPVDAYGHTDFGTDFDDPEPVPAAAQSGTQPRPVAQVEATAVHRQPIPPPDSASSDSASSDSAPSANACSVGGCPVAACARRSHSHRVFRQPGPRGPARAWRDCRNR